MLAVEYRTFCCDVRLIVYYCLRPTTCMLAMIYFLTIKFGILNESRKFFQMHGYATRHGVPKTIIAVFLYAIAWMLTCKQDKFLGNFGIVLPKCCRSTCLKVIIFSRVKLYIYFQTQANL